MSDLYTFYPPRRLGTLFQLGLILILMFGGAWGIWKISSVDVAPELLPYLTITVLALILVPFFLYRLYGLQRSHYVIERGGITLQWGWRTEVIPLDQINWIHPAEQLEPAPRLPAVHWPGAVLGSRGTQGNSRVEFMASRARQLIVISAGQEYYVISPPDLNQFLDAYREVTELGTLDLLEPDSFNPAQFLYEIVSRRWIQVIFLAAVILNVTLLTWTLLIIPRRELISLGFSPQGEPYQPLGSLRLVLFPILNTGTFLTNLILGLFLYRSPENRLYSYLLWSTSVLISLMFHLALLLIIS